MKTLKIGKYQLQLKTMSNGTIAMVMPLNEIQERYLRKPSNGNIGDPYWTTQELQQLTPDQENITFTVDRERSKQQLEETRRYFIECQRRYWEDIDTESTMMKDVWEE